MYNIISSNFLLLRIQTILDSPQATLTLLLHQPHLPFNFHPHPSPPPHPIPPNPLSHPSTPSKNSIKPIHSTTNHPSIIKSKTPPSTKKKETHPFCEIPTYTVYKLLYVYIYIYLCTVLYIRSRQPPQKQYPLTR